MDRDRDWRRLTVHSRKKQATAEALSLLLRVPYQIGRAVGTLWQFVTNRLILVIAVATLVVPLSTIGGDLVAHPSDDHYRGSDVLALRGSGVDHSTHGSDRSILY